MERSGGVIDHVSRSPSLSGGSGEKNKRKRRSGGPEVWTGRGGFIWVGAEKALKKILKAVPKRGEEKEKKNSNYYQRGC